MSVALAAAGGPVARTAVPPSVPNRRAAGAVARASFCELARMEARGARHPKKCLKKLGAFWGILHVSSTVAGPVGRCRLARCPKGVSKLNDLEPGERQIEGRFVLMNTYMRRRRSTRDPTTAPLTNTTSSEKNAEDLLAMGAHRPGLVRSRRTGPTT